MAAPRLTRKKAAELADQMHIDEDALLEPPIEDLLLQAKAYTPEPNDRPALGEIAPNSADSKTQPEEGAQELRKSTRGKKGGKKAGAKGSKNNLKASTADPADTTNQQQEVLPDDSDSAPSPASEKAADDLMKDVQEPEKSSSSVDDTRPQIPAVRLTRSQLGKRVNFESEPKSLVDGIRQTVEEQDETMKEERHTEETNPFFETHQSDDTALVGPHEDPISPMPSAVPKVIATLRSDTPAKRSTSNKENVEPDSFASPQTSTYDVLEHAVVARSTPPASTRQSIILLEDPIAALDQLDDAVEDVNKDIPEVQTSPEKPKVAKNAKKAAPVVRTTKASQARISMAQTSKGDSSKAPALGRPRPSMTLGRSISVRQTTSTRSEPPSKRITSSGSAAGKGTEREASREKREVVIPHSKPRPISLSFPTPPPPARSTKAPTQSTFQLPGDAVAAKLKAAREARALREAEEEEKKKAFKARPVPTALSKAPSVRGTNASKARESIMSGKDPKLSRPTQATGHSRAHSVATTQPATTKACQVSKDSTKTSTVPSRLASDSLSISKRPSTALAVSSTTTGKPRTSLSTSTGPRLASNPTKGTTKGKEVFGRAAAAKASAEKEKAEKEAAAKKARAEAAERGRLASREWAEKQKAKKAAAAAPKQTPEVKAEEQASVGAQQVADEPPVATEGAVAV